MIILKDLIKTWVNELEETYHEQLDVQGNT